MCDLAIALAVGGDCLADIAVLRAEPGLLGPVASDPTVSRLIDTLAKDADTALAALARARAHARADTTCQPVSSTASRPAVKQARRPVRQGCQ